MNINKLVKKAHDNAVDKGFYDIEGTGMIDTKRNISELLMLIVSELGEAQEALRNNFRAAIHTFERDINTIGHFSVPVFKECIKDSFEDEIADTFIRLADLCGYLNIDIEKHIKYKMQYNATKPRKHGKEF